MSMFYRNFVLDAVVKVLASGEGKTRYMGGTHTNHEVGDAIK